MAQSWSWVCQVADKKSNFLSYPSTVQPEIKKTKKINKKSYHFQANLREGFKNQSSKTFTLITEQCAKNKTKAKINKSLC